VVWSYVVAKPGSGRNFTLLPDVSRNMKCLVSLACLCLVAYGQAAGSPASLRFTRDSSPFELGNARFPLIEARSKLTTLPTRAIVPWRVTTRGTADRKQEPDTEQMAREQRARRPCGRELRGKARPHLHTRHQRRDGRRHGAMARFSSSTARRANESPYP
jgi:hypothetical protein